MKVKEIMTTEVVTVFEDNTVEEAAQLLMRHRLRGLPVINQAGTLIGIVTEYELISQQGHTVADIMNRGVITVLPMGWQPHNTSRSCAGCLSRL
jgi:CBS-domain-containing membrane protein